jgi:imidazoleglycerol-phosphate dehydratase / histidinol-phosphatase
MKKVLINSKLFSQNAPNSKGLISGLINLQSKGCSLFINIPVNSLNPLLVKILKMENISIKGIDSKITCDYSISLKGNNSLLINNKIKINNFENAIAFIISELRFSKIVRKTKETDITVKVSLDSKKESIINTGIGFFDHMLFQIARHGNIYLNIKVKGDLKVDEHHTVEDTALALGQALLEALGTKSGIKRYGFSLPMDDSVAFCTIDLGGRAYLNFKAKFKRDKVGEFPTELTKEFFRALSTGMKANIYLKSEGENDHHKIESLFKVFAKALNEACRLDNRAVGILPTTKGML